MTAQPGVSQQGISLVIPLFNKRAEIERCLASVAAQTIQPAEVLLVDDGSTDGGANLAVRSKCPNLRIIRQPNQGVSAARNTGILASRSPLIAFLDADDEWKPCFIETISRLRAEFPEAGAFATAFVMDKGRQGFHPFVSKTGSRVSCLVPHFLAPTMAMHSSGVAVRREVFDRVGYFRRGLSRGEDVDMWFRIACVYPVAYSPSIMAVWHWAASNRASVRLKHSYDDFLSRSLRDLTEAGLVTDSVRLQAEGYIRWWMFETAKAIAYEDPHSGTAALRQWKCTYPVTPDFIIHYSALLLAPTLYGPAVAAAATIKQWIRNAHYRMKGTVSHPRDLRT